MSTCLFLVERKIYFLRVGDLDRLQRGRLIDYQRYRRHPRGITCANIVWDDAYRGFLQRFAASKWNVSVLRHFVVVWNRKEVSLWSEMKLWSDEILWLYLRPAESLGDHNIILLCEEGNTIYDAGSSRGALSTMPAMK